MAAKTEPTAGKLIFPSQEAIVAYLAKHPATSNNYFKEKKIYEAVAKYFANSATTSGRVDIGVISILHNLKAKISEVASMSIRINLTQALQDCANGEKIELEKTEGKSETAKF